MSGILCAIRGGPESQAPIACAIDLAEETGLPLVFLYVVNLDFLSHATSCHIPSVKAEMHQMGEFILLTAQSTARERGVTAEGTVRQGNVTEEIISPPPWYGDIPSSIWRRAHRAPIPVGPHILCPLNA